MIVWPADFGARFMVTVDTEEEFDWNAPFSRNAQSTRATRALPNAHRYFAEAGVPVTYMVDYPVVNDPGAVEILLKAVVDGRSTIGAQLHPWVTPPFDEELTRTNSFPGNLVPALEAAKLNRLTAAIGDAFGKRPIAYRAGRYGLGPNSAAAIAALGYRLDTSVRARYDYRRIGGPDFSAVGNGAFRFGPDRRLIQVPLTTVWTGAARARGIGLYRAAGRVPYGRGALARLGLLSRVSLTPEGMPLADALAAVRIALDEGERLLNFSFHSPSLVPGNTPYVRDAGDLRAFYRWWDGVLDLLGQRGAGVVSLAEAIAAADQAAGKAS